MTKSTGVGRGGKRAGAGRKHLLQRPEAAVVKTVAAAVAVITKQAAPDAAQVDSGVVITAESLVQKAYRTLDDVMANSPFPAPRVTAARAIIDLAKAEAAAASAAVGGKKMAAINAAHGRVADGGKFGVPPSPESWDALLN